MLTYDELLAGHLPATTISAADVHESNTQHRAPILVVLDDDPTGTQSVSNLPVLTSWKPEDLAWAFDTGAPAVYVMTNSRSLDPAEAEKVNREVVEASYAAAKNTPGLRISFVSRSDSTLRGHFPLEPRTLADAIAGADDTAGGVDGIIVLPAFPDAGRITVDGIHYAGSVSTGFIPVGESEFARDATFGYSSSSLAQWVEEKTDGDIAAADVLCICLDDLRGDLAAVKEILRRAQSGVPIVVDVVEETDMRALALALNEVEAEGKRYIYRVGPPFVRARIGQEIKSPLNGEELREVLRAEEAEKGGLIVVGSHVALTTRQLDNLIAAQSPKVVEIDVIRVLEADEESGENTYISELAREVARELADGNVVVRTSRTLVKGVDADDSLRIARRVSAAVVDVVQQTVARARPRFVVAKGGITSSDTASRGLGIGRARVVGPMLPGIVSMWEAYDGATVGIPYIVFAGNVGDEFSLRDVVDRLSA